MTSEERARLVEALSNEIWPHVAPLLAGKEPQVQGAVLADLVARWIAGHFVPGSQWATHRVRERFLNLHIETVRKLVPVNAKQMGTD